MPTLALHRAKNIPGWMSDAELSLLAELAQESKTIFEIGSYMGRSTRVLGDNCSGTVYAIDPWEVLNYDGGEFKIIFETDESVYNMFYCHNHDLIKKGRIIPVRSTWKDFQPKVKPDLIFIDGGHNYQNVLEDGNKAKLCINSHGIIAGHDYSPGWPGVVKAVNELFAGKRVYLHDTIWWTKL